LNDANLFIPPNETHHITFSQLNKMPHGVVVSDARDYELQMGRGTVGKIGSEYNLTYSHFPYNVLTIIRNPGEGLYSHEVYVESGDNSTVMFKTFPYNMESCYFSYVYPLGRRVEECNTFEKASTTLSISTDKKKYEVNETIKVDVDFEAVGASDSADIIVTYGNEPQVVSTSSGGSGSAEFTARMGGYPVKAFFPEDEERSPASTPGTSVYATDKNTGTYINLAIIGFTVYTMIFFYKKYAEVIAQ
jgi:hypothetical protein